MPNARTPHAQPGRKRRKPGEVVRRNKPGTLCACLLLDPAHTRTHSARIKRPVI